MTSDTDNRGWNGACGLLAKSNHPDTLAGDDTTLLYPVYLEEKLSQNYYQKKPAKTKQIVVAQKRVD